uniref:homogentisate 1,2-dioxygenase n=1 Tax=Neobodo designis TaxID=312471 RepID=A0A7S1MIK8_NEODS|mmetsp:Transcript_41348/g.127800  ORF Transcript_41348/g.127800 Transcript_41348/m.127800 type:complete len:464 (+) Transcript_41348:73-1464(+)
MSQRNNKQHRSESAAKAAPADEWASLKYITGFGGEVKSEVLEGALPPVGNTPQKCNYGLYAEQINGTAFTKVRHENRRTWCYRIKPSAEHDPFQPVAADYAPHLCDECDEGVPDQMRWMPPPIPSSTAKDSKSVNFVQGMSVYCGAGDSSMKAGIRCYVYTCNASMVNESFSSSDGDMLIVPQCGTLNITTEFGRMQVPSGFIAVIQRGIRFSVAVPAEGARGYVCEVFDSQFELPPLGAIGANGLSNPRDFETVTAWYEDRDASWTHYQKFTGRLFSHGIKYSPFNVAAWHGNYAPYRYDLAKFCVINSVSYDHLDPSIFCVLTAQTAEKGVACCDFVIFPPRWMVQENTFRPPYYHRNTMSEFMGNIRGVYEAKTDGGFLPGGATLHSPMAGHGPAADVHAKASNAKLAPMPPDENALAFMFESVYMMKMSKHALTHMRDQNYNQCWQGFPKHFNPAKQEP